MRLSVRRWHARLRRLGRVAERVLVRALGRQLQHQMMLVVRKQGEGHESYNEFRSAFELLEAVGREPHDKFVDDEQEVDVRTEVEELKIRVAAQQCVIEELQAAEERAQAHRQAQEKALEELRTTVAMLAGRVQSGSGDVA